MVACTNNKQADEKPAPLYPQPQTVEANPTNGYAINPVTNDSIQPIILENGNTLQTGVPIPATGKVISPNNVSQPKSFKVPPQNQLTKINAHPNIYKIPDELTVIPVNEDSLTKIVLMEITKDDTFHYHINNTGDTVKTGVPIPAIDNKVTSTLPKPTKALPPRFKDAANINIQYLDVDHGMTSSAIYSILEDKNGNIWFGTYAGVSKYDGESFVHFTEKEGLSNNLVCSIIEDKSGNLWFGTDGGVSKYDGKSFVHFTEKEGLSDNNLLAILEDRKGNIWFGTDGGGVSKYDGESFVHFTKKEGLINNNILSMIEDKNGNIWFGTDGGVCKYDGESFIHFTEKDGLNDNTVWSILEDNKGNIWFGTFGGVSKYDGESFVNFTKNEGLSNNTILSIKQDKNENIWFGTNGGVSKYDGKSFVHFTENEGLSNNNLLAILEDKNGNIWFGTDGGGVSKYKGESFVHLTKKEGLSDHNVLSILEDKNGSIWFGTAGGGVCKYNGESIIHFTEKEGLSDISVMSILEDRNGNLWFGTYGGGVSKYDGESFVHFTEKEGLSNNTVYSILEDKNGYIWFGTDGGGVSKYNGESFVHFTEKEGLSNNYVFSILEDKDGNLWFGTAGGGVSKYDGKSFIHLTEKEGLSDNTVYSILEDKNGNLWFGTNGGGVCKYDGKSFIYFTEKEGLTDNTIYSILEDKNNQDVRIWLSTGNGLNELVEIKGGIQKVKQGQKDLEKINPVKYTINRFEKNDGLKGMDFYPNSALIDSRNRAWWGNEKSLTKLDMNKFNKATYLPVVSMNSLEINEQFLDYRNLTDSLRNTINFNDLDPFKNYPLNLKLPFYKNHLTFHFSAIDWSAPHKIQYSYLMEGLNTTWSQPSKEAKADYRNIPYGTFTFKVRAIGESGQWSKAFGYTFTINPPWWHTWWARSLYSIFALIFIFTLISWRTAKLKQGQKKLEIMVDNATKKIKEQKNKAEKQRDEIEEAHKEITDSINYAERIQRSFLATDELLNKNLGEYFVFFQPKDVVSGDFYWAGELSNGNFAMVNADSTGHGVPGAIMSILNISSIEKAIDKGLTSPVDIFNDTRKTIIERLKKDGSQEGGKDGMDASIICFDFKNNKFTYTAAQNPIWVIRNGEVIQIKGEKMPVGKHDMDSIPFVGGEFEIEKGDKIYTLTDGFQDQFGGPKSKKFMIKNMREYILSISHLPMKEQQQKISEVFLNWKGDLEQVDDVCIIGVKI